MSILAFIMYHALRLHIGQCAVQVLRKSIKKWVSNCSLKSWSQNFEKCGRARSHEKYNNNFVDHHSFEFAIWFIFLLFKFISLISLGFTWSYLNLLGTVTLLYVFFSLSAWFHLTSHWSYLTSLGTVTWQFILLLFGTLLRYTWYCLISLHCLEALDTTWPICHQVACQASTNTLNSLSSLR